MKTFVLYHANCPDGTCAAAIASMALPDAQLIPVNYGQPAPEMEEGSNVFIVDFSYPRETLMEMQRKHPALTVIDHHKTAQKDLEGLDFCHFDMTQSGAMLTWRYFFPNNAPSVFVQYVQDRDLWAWKLSHSREFSAGLRMRPFDPAIYRDFVVRDEIVHLLIAEGKVALKLQSAEVEAMCKNVRWIWFQVSPEGDVSCCWTDLGFPDWIRTNQHGTIYKAPCVNASVNFSEVGEHLLELFPNAPFAAYYFDRSDKRQWGIRARKSFDASVIAKGMGGGGHPQACGFTTSL